MAAARKRSDIYNLVWTRWQVAKKRFGQQHYREDVDRKFEATNPAWQRSRAYLTKLIVLAHAHSIRVIVLPFPVLSAISEQPYPFQKYVRAVCDAARAVGAECVDSVPVLQHSNFRLTVSKVEDHPSAQVYGKLAEQLAGVVSPAPPPFEELRGRL